MIRRAFLASLLAPLLPRSEAKPVLIGWDMGRGESRSVDLEEYRKASRILAQVRIRAASTTYFGPPNSIPRTLS